RTQFGTTCGASVRNSLFGRFASRASFCGAAARGKLMLLVGAVIGLTLIPAARADTVYNYTGTKYTNCGGNYCNNGGACTCGPYALSVSFRTTLSGSALSSLQFKDISGTVTAYRFTDGSGLTFDSSTNPAAQVQFEISTDA